VFCFCRAARRCVFVGTKRVANRIMRSVSMFERKKKRKDWLKKGGWVVGALTLCTRLVSRVLEEMGFLKLTSRNSKNIVS